MELKACSCGSTIFETIRTYQYDATDFYIDSRSKEIRTEVNGIPVAKCIQCGKINIPSTSMAGVSLMDPRVGAYRELLRAVEVRNKNIESASKVDLAIDGLYMKVFNLMTSDKTCACSVKTEEASVVETANGSRKKPKTDIP